jgi:hypothetical protein
MDKIHDKKRGLTVFLDYGSQTFDLVFKSDLLPRYCQIPNIGEF